MDQSRPQAEQAAVRQVLRAHDRNGEELKNVFIKTYGCQMNVYDSERMIDALAPFGYAPAEDAEAADLILLNTCHIREKAAEKVYSELGRLRRMKEARAATGSQMTHRRRRLRRAGRGRRDHPPRAPASIWSSARSPTTACRS